ncbi:MAG: hypothetical protein WA918_01415 [Erythrobacter sp.]
MSEGAIISIVALLGWLVLAGGAIASMRLGWNRILRLVLIWAAIFGGLFLLADLFGAGLPT